MFAYGGLRKSGTPDVVQSSIIRPQIIKVPQNLKPGPAFYLFRELAVKLLRSCAVGGTEYLAELRFRGGRLGLRTTRYRPWFRA